MGWLKLGDQASGQWTGQAAGGQLRAGAEGAHGQGGAAGRLDRVLDDGGRNVAGAGRGGLTRAWGKPGVSDGDDAEAADALTGAVFDAIHVALGKADARVH